MTALQEKLRHARARLLLNFPFFGYLVTHLTDTLDAEKTRTASTDGEQIFWSPAFLQKLSLGDTVFVLAHEALHVALCHLFRKQERARALWNLATDMCVNDALSQGGLSTTLPCLYGARGANAEEVYERLLAKAPKSTLQSWDDHALWEALSPAERGALRERWRAALSQATSFGKAPAGLLTEVEHLLYPRRDWRQILQEALQVPVDYRAFPPDRRFPGLFLPTLSEERRRIAIALDSSGSISSRMLSEFFAEVRAILESGPYEGRLFVCDAAIQQEIPLYDFDLQSIKALPGGGGTDFTPVFERLEEGLGEGWAPDMLVYFTDLEGHFPMWSPSFRVLWVVASEEGIKKVPFGEIVVLAGTRFW